MLNLKKLLTKIMNNVAIFRSAVIQTDTISGNADAEVSFASAFSGTPYAVIVNGWTPATSWNTTLSVQTIDTARKIIRIRTFGSTAQAYNLRCIAIYVGGYCLTVFSRLSAILGRSFARLGVA